MTETKTRTVEQTVRIAPRPETVWRFWTDPERMREWWGTSSNLEARPGGTCRVVMGAAGPIMSGEFLELVPYEKIVFSFGWEPIDGTTMLAPGSTRVEVTLAAHDGGTLLTLRHTGIPTPHAEEHRNGWAHFLPILVEVAGAAERQTGTATPTGSDD